MPHGSDDRGRVAPEVDVCGFAELKTVVTLPLAMFVLHIEQEHDVGTDGRNIGVFGVNAQPVPLGNRVEGCSLVG